MGQTMRAMLEADRARRLAQLAEDEIDLSERRDTGVRHRSLHRGPRHDPNEHVS